MRKRRVINYKRVALAIGVREYSHQRRKIQGIIDYYTKHCAWALHRNQELQPFISPEHLPGWVGDGVIGEIYTQEDLENLQSLGIPIVNTSSSDLARDVPTVSVDNHAIGRMAAEHLVDCKLDNFAFIGPKGLCHVRERLEGFARALEDAGSKCQTLLYQPLPRRSRHESEESVDPSYLKDAVGELKFPVGIMTSSDRVGFSVLEASRQLGLRSPEDIALVGVDNDDIFCQLAYSTMTSIEPNAREVGFQAASLLDSLMNGSTPEQTRIRIPPQRLLFRNSTDMSRSKYPEVARALRFIRNHANEFIDVTNVLDVVPVSRRWLEMKFKEEVGHGIYQEIRRVHIERARELLETTDWPVLRVVRESGFSSAERFDFAFQKLVGMSASEYRKRKQKRPR
jgi:LacI family transcriptional regulator